ncbi:hypothetical protein FQN54_005401 [Arachnomyces sp. PD_36]|nr:hypothetical protein FQN54_005401 [Arachnomyces sp. PD_36]
MLFQSSTRYAAAASLALLGSVTAAPLQTRAVEANLLEEFGFYGQYAAAAYCPGNNNSTGTKLTCSTGNCPLVEAANTTTLTEFEDSMVGDVTGFLAVDSTNKLLVLSFRGASSTEAWIANLDFVRVDSDLCDDCGVHKGFWESWLSVVDPLTEAVEQATADHPDYSLVFTGHSAGAAVATIAASAFRNAGTEVDLFSYGGPRVGDENLAAYLTSQDLGRSYRVTHTADPVPRLPPRLFGYSHTSPEYWITSDTGVEVTTKDIEVITETDSDDGNAGTGGLDIDAHGWYFNDISAC